MPRICIILSQKSNRKINYQIMVFLKLLGEGCRGKIRILKSKWIMA
jgi:hypothetical protein